MSLGRPAMRRKEERIIESRIREHIRLMNKYIAEGMARDVASKKAYLEMGKS